MVELVDVDVAPAFESGHTKLNGFWISLKKKQKTIQNIHEEIEKKRMLVIKYTFVVNHHSSQAVVIGRRHSKRNIQRVRACFYGEERRRLDARETGLY